MKSLILHPVVDTGEQVLVEHQITGSRDPKDDKFLSLAVAGEADFLVTGDKDLLTLATIGAIPILTPTAFLVKISE